MVKNTCRWYIRSPYCHLERIMTLNEWTSRFCRWIMTSPLVFGWSSLQLWWSFGPPTKFTGKPPQFLAKSQVYVNDFKSGAVVQRFKVFFFGGGFLALRKTQLWNQRLVFFAPTDEGTVCCAGPWDDLRTFDYYPIIIRVLYNIWLSTRTGRYLYILVYFDISYDILFVWNKLVSFTGFQSKTPVVTWSIHLPLVATKQLDLLSPSLEELLKMVGLVMECHVYWTIHGKYGIRSIDHLSYLWIIEIYLRTLFYFIYFWFMEIFGNANAIILI